MSDVLKQISDFLDRRTLSSMLERYKKAATRIVEHENKVNEREHNKACKVLDDLIPEILAIKLAIAESKLHSSGRATVVSTIISSLIETLSPQDVYGMFEAITANLQQMIFRKDSFNRVMFVPMGMAEQESEKDESKNPLVS